MIVPFLDPEVVGRCAAFIAESTAANVAAIVDRDWLGRRFMPSGPGPARPVDTFPGKDRALAAGRAAAITAAVDAFGAHVVGAAIVAPDRYSDNPVETWAEMTPAPIDKRPKRVADDR